MSNVYVGGLPVNNAASTVENETYTGNNTFSGTNTFSGATVHSGAVSFPGGETGRVTTNVVDNVTLGAADCGIVQNVTVDAKVVTLPATSVGLTFTIRNGGADGAVLVAVSPNASDKISGNGFTATDNKDALNTKATAKKGDLITLVADGVDGWYITELVGVWARE